LTTGALKRCFTDNYINCFKEKKFDFTFMTEIVMQDNKDNEVGFLNNLFPEVIK